jgi:hypothetical protein
MTYTSLGFAYLRDELGSPDLTRCSATGSAIGHLLRAIEMARGGA